MPSVTNRANQIKQPWGGYLRIQDFQTFQFFDNSKISDEENVNAGLIGSAVDYLTRFMLGNKPKEAFSISLKGALNACRMREAKELLKDVHQLDDTAVAAALKLATFDVWYRCAGKITDPDLYVQLKPNKQTINDIIVMVNRNLKVLKKYGPVTKMNFTFSGERILTKLNGEKIKIPCDGYTTTVSSGDGDILTKDIMWDLKTNKKTPDSKDTLQLLMYYVMGKYSCLEEFDKINKIAIFNARQNILYLYVMSRINPQLIKFVEKEIICYPD